MGPLEEHLKLSQKEVFLTNSFKNNRNKFLEQFLKLFSTFFKGIPEEPGRTSGEFLEEFLKKIKDQRKKFFFLENRSSRQTVAKAFQIPINSYLNYGFWMKWAGN